MQYRRFGKTEIEVSALGFGCMRFPTIGSKINEPEATRMLRRSIDEGVNYIDTAYPYHGKDFNSAGQSEPFLKKALSDGYRDKVNIATKLPCWLVKDSDDMTSFLDEQLERLGVDSIDFYLLHSLTGDTWKRMKSLGVVSFLNEALKSGKIKYAGFSYHGNGGSDFTTIVDGYDWSFCQIQYNYLDEDYQAGLEGLKYASSKDLGIAIMEPLRGGSLINVPSTVQNLFNNADTDRSTAEWGLRWLWNQEEVGVVLSGMSLMAHVEDNLLAASRSGVNVLSPDEMNMFDQVKGIMKNNQAVGCTACRYCMPCPVGVNIPEVFKYYNVYMNSETDVERIKAAGDYHKFLQDHEKADQCIQCGKCEQHCPQAIKIKLNMKEIESVFEVIK